MDLAYNLQQFNVLRGNACGRYTVMDGVNSRSGFKMSALRSGSLGNARLAVRWHVFKDVRRKMEPIGLLNSSLCSGRKVDHLTFQYGKSVIGGIETRSKLLKQVFPAQCLGHDSMQKTDKNGKVIEIEEDKDTKVEEEGGQVGVEGLETPNLDELREFLQKARRKLETAQLNSSMFEEKAHKISETAISLKDEVINARNDVTTTLGMIEEITKEEIVAEEAVQKATMDLSLAEAKLQVALESLEVARKRLASSGIGADDFKDIREEEDTGVLKLEKEALFLAQEEVRQCKTTLENCEADLILLQSRKNDLQGEVHRLNEVADKAQVNAMKVEEDVAKIMLLAEKAVAVELEAAQQVNDAEMALLHAEKFLVHSLDVARDIRVQQSDVDLSIDEGLVKELVVGQPESSVKLSADETGKDSVHRSPSALDKPLTQGHSEPSNQSIDESSLLGSLSNRDTSNSGSVKDSDVDVDKFKNTVQAKKPEIQKDITWDSSPLSAPKPNKSSRFFPASFFSFQVDDTELTPSSAFHGLIEYAREQLPKLIVGLLLLGAGYVMLLTLDYFAFVRKV